MDYGLRSERRGQAQLDVDLDRLYKGDGQLLPGNNLGRSGFRERYNAALDTVRRTENPYTRYEETIAEADAAIKTLIERGYVPENYFRQDRLTYLGEVLTGDAKKLERRERVLTDNADNIKTIKRSDPDAILSLDEIRSRQTERVQDTLGRDAAFEENTTFFSGRLGDFAGEMRALFEDPWRLASAALSVGLPTSGLSLAQQASISSVFEGVSDRVIRFARMDENVEFTRRNVNPDFTATEQLAEDNLSSGVAGAGGGAGTVAGHYLGKLIGRGFRGLKGKVSQDLDDVIDVADVIATVGDQKPPGISMDDWISTVAKSAEDVMAGKDIDAPAFSAETPPASIYNPITPEPVPLLEPRSHAAQLKERIDAGQYQDADYLLSPDPANPTQKVPPAQFLREQLDDIRVSSELDACILLG